MAEVEIDQKRHRSTTQLFRFVVVGVASNLIGYLLYLLITYLGLAPKVAMTLLYATGVVLSFVGNKSYTFGHSGASLNTGFRYITAHAFGYLINLSIQILMVDKLGYAHQLAQAIGVGVVAVFLFITFKKFVFVNRAQSEVGER